MNRLLAAATVALTGATLFTALPAGAATLANSNEYVLFGDSISDPGNYFDKYGLTDAIPWYPDNQITDGDTWASQLGLDSESGQNFAFANGGARYNADFDDDLGQQIRSYKDSDLDKSKIDKAIIFVGTNDLAEITPKIRFLAPALVNLLIDQTIDTIAKGIATLSAQGINEFYLFGVPDLSQSPLTKSLAATLGPFQAKVLLNLDSQRVLNFNAALAELADNINLAGGTAHFVDVYTIFNDLADEAEDAGINVDEACVVGDFLKPVSICDDPENYFFYDELHFSEAAHAAFAAEVAPLLSGVQPLAQGSSMLAPGARPSASVVTTPLPLSGVLLVGGIGALAVLRARRADRASAA